MLSRFVLKDTPWFASLTHSDRIVLVHSISLIIDVTTRMEVVDSNARSSCADDRGLAILCVGEVGPPEDLLDP